MKRKRWRRRGTLRVESNDRRDPMRRLLEDGNNTQSGMVEVQYDQQWRTLFRAQQLGYVDDAQRLTDAGRTFLTLTQR